MGLSFQIKEIEMTWPLPCRQQRLQPQQEEMKMSKFAKLSQACRDEKIFGRLIGIFFLILGLVFLIIGFTVLPLFGLIVAIPLIALGVYFLRKSPGEDEACSTDL
jgi:uncharacterized membrane protein